MDIASLLKRFGFTGSYRIVTHSLPHPKIVLREIRSMYPDLDIEIVTSPQDLFAVS